MKGLGAELAILQTALQKVLPDSAFDPHADFIGHGGDSLRFVSFVLALGSDVPDSTLEKVRPDRPMRAIAALLHQDGRIDQPHAREDSKCREAHVGPVAMTANRPAFLLRMPRQIDRWILVGDLLEVDQPFDPAVMQRAVGAMIDSFDSLRLRLRPTADDYIQEMVEASTIDPAGLLTIVDVREGDVDAFLRSTVQRALKLVDSRQTPFRIVIADRGRSHGFGLVLLCHHVLTDAISNSVLRDALVTTYRRLFARRPGEIEVSLDYSAYCDLYLEDCRRRRDIGLRHWRSQPWSSISRSPLDAGGPRGASDLSAEVADHVKLGDFDALGQMLRLATGFGFEAIAIAAIAKAYGEVTRRSHLCLGLVTHGRGYLPHGADARLTVGWTTEVIPTILPTGAPLPDILRAARTGLIDAERLGRLYGYLRHLDPDPAIRGAFAEHADPNMTLNILPYRAPTPSSYTRRTFGWDHSWEGQRPFAMSGGLAGAADGAHLSWDFDTGLVDGDLANVFLAACIREIHASLNVLLGQLPAGTPLRRWAPQLTS